MAGKFLAGHSVSAIGFALFTTRKRIVRNRFNRCPESRLFFRAESCKNAAVQNKKAAPEAAKKE
ncbi:MAG: hypothetical protein R3D69_07615 [Xanthobacteraceae bacterium]